VFERIKIRQLENRMKLEVLQRQAEALSMANSSALKASLEDEDESKWILLGGESPKELSGTDQDTLRRNAQTMFYRNCHARNLIRLIEKYVVGRGFTITPKSEEEKVSEHWNTFWRNNRMELRKKEIVRRTMRDGECFIRYFKERDGQLSVRFMQPDKIANPEDKQGANANLSHGIETDRNDIETVIAYWYDGQRIAAEDVQHIKIFADSDVLRGRSYLEPAMAHLNNYKTWLRDRINLNRLRSMVGLVRKVEGTPTQAANIKAGYETSARTAPDGTPLMRAPDGVSLFTVNKGVSYEFMTPNLQASDVQNDGRAILLAVAAGAGQPEYMVTSDASNANYASTMVAEAPGVREFIDWQDFFGEQFREMYMKVIRAGIEAGALPSKETYTDYIDSEETVVQQPTPQERMAAAATGEIVEPKTVLAKRKKPVKRRRDTSTECLVIFPEVIHRDIKAETEAYQIQEGIGVISKRTIAARLDLDYDEEVEQMRREDEEADQPVGVAASDETAAAQSDEETHKGPPEQ